MKNYFFKSSFSSLTAEGANEGYRIGKYEESIVWHNYLFTKEKDCAIWPCRFGYVRTELLETEPLEHTSLTSLPLYVNEVFIMKNMQTKGRVSLN